jgi:hypothetical protein
MSAYHTQKTQYKDRDCLVAALNAQGYKEVEVHEVATNLYGYHGDMRSQKANVIVRRKFVGAAANDLGFVKAEDGTYSAIVSAYDSGKHDEGWFKHLKKAYTEAVDMKTAAKQGFKFLGKKIVNGKVQLQFADTRA